MSAAAASSSVHASGNHQGWITPQEQLDRRGSHAQSASILTEGHIGAVIIKTLMGNRKGEKPGFCKDVAIRIVEFLMPACFGASEYQRYWGVHVGPMPPIPFKMSAFFCGTDPIDRSKQVYETHLPPVFRPRWITETNAKGEKELSCFSLRTLGSLVKRSKEGSPSLEGDSQVLQQIGNSKAGPARWLVMRKNVLERERHYGEQQEYMQKLNAAGAEYDEMPSALDLATIVFATHVHTGGDRHLGDSTGMEGCWTFSRCTDRIKSGEKFFPVYVGGFAPAGVQVSNGSYDYGYECVGVAALRKF